MCVCVEDESVLGVRLCRRRISVRRECVEDESVLGVCVCAEDESVLGV